MMLRSRQNEPVEPDDDTDELSDDNADPDADDAPPRSNSVMAVAGVVGTLIVALIVLAVVLLVSIGNQPEVKSANSKASFNSLEQNGMFAARQEVLKLTTLSTANADAQIKSLLADATGSFRDNLSQIATALKKAVVNQKVTTVGRVSESGVVSSDAATSTVTVLVAAEQQVKNASVPAGEPRTYRLMVKMQKVKTKYLVADMAFVP